MKKSLMVFFLLMIGVAIGSVTTFFGYHRLSDLVSKGEGIASQNVAEPVEKKPLYWVAPMDSNYRRDKPGKSPMGMDLVPVYEENDGGSDEGPGAIKISPSVVNNLGVRVAKAEMAELHPVIQTVGYVGYDEDHLVHIHPRVEGWIEKLYIKASGDPIKKGQPLYEIYSPALVNAQEELVIALDRKKDRLIKAAEDRLAALRVPNSVVQQIKKNRSVRQTVTFYSPQSGVVDNLVIRQGFYVKPGSTIMSIGTLDQVWVEAEVFERQASYVSPGLPVAMTLDYLPGKEWKGVVDYVYPTLDAKTRTVRVRLRFDNKDGLLKPNMYAQIVVYADISGKTLLIPKEAVIRTGTVNRVVLVLGEGRFKSINVKIGRYDESYAEILSGLKEGDQVVTSAQFLIDSESSKTSDFKRMNHEEDTPLPTSVWTEATINSIMVDHRKLNASHKEIAQWSWPEMTMDFVVADSVDIASLKEGQNLNIEISKTENDQYQITATHVPGSEEGRSLDDLSFDDMSLDDVEMK